MLTFRSIAGFIILIGMYILNMRDQDNSTELFICLCIAVYLFWPVIKKTAVGFAIKIAQKTEDQQYESILNALCVVTDANEKQCINKGTHWIKLEGQGKDPREKHVICAAHLPDGKCSGQLTVFLIRKGLSIVGYDRLYQKNADADTKS